MSIEAIRERDAQFADALNGLDLEEENWEWQAVGDRRALLTEIEQLTASLGAAHERIRRWQSEIDVVEKNVKLREALSELHAMVWGEARSLLDEDSGGCARLDIEIRNLLGT